MHSFQRISRAAGVSALLALSTIPVAAHAGKADEARAAIAEARGKIDAGNKVGASGVTPEMQSRAQAALASAEAHLNKGDKDAAISDAHHASELADMALVNTDRRKEASAQDSRMDAEASASAAQQSAAAANERADAAQQAAATANAQADALRNAPPPAPAPAPTTTTVQTVEREAVQTPARHVVRKPVHTTTAAVKKTTTTTVTTAPGAPQQ